MRFNFATAAQIIFGPGTLNELGSRAPSLGSRALVVTGRNPARAAPLFDILDGCGITYTTFSISGEPTIALAQEGAWQAREMGCDFVIGIGGGSALDAGKAVAALVTNPGDPLDYLEVIGKGRPIQKAAAPYVAIPTTAGTGSEVTSNAVLSSPEHRVKVSLRSPLMLPRLALVDPLLTHSAPPDVTAQTGLDALTQVLEPFVSNQANPMTDGICREGMSRAARALRRAFEDGDDAEARADMALVGLFGGLALSNAKLGAVHGFAGPFGGMFDAPHGAICARLLPYVMRVNLRVLQTREPESPALQRYDEIALILTGSANAAASDGVRWVEDVCTEMAIPGLGTYGMTPADFPALIEKSSVSSSMKGNPIRLTPDEMQEILTLAQ